MDTKELKFLLRLLGCENYRSSLSKIKPNDKTTAVERDRICQNLQLRELVACSYEITKLKIAPAGKNLLEIDTAKLPITVQELKVLRACQKEKISPGKTGIPTKERQEIIQNLVDRGLIDIDKKIKEVWISERGLEYLRDEYTDKGYQSILSLDMLTNYLRFLRKSLRGKPEQGATLSPTTGESDVITIINLTDEDILQTIQKLDHELGTENYLPIFHVRQKLQPPLSRDELDKALYRLEEAERIELSTLADPDDYIPEQVDAGISQISGGSLFFITVT